MHLPGAIPWLSSTRDTDTAPWAQENGLSIPNFIASCHPGLCREVDHDQGRGCISKTGAQGCTLAPAIPCHSFPFQFSAVYLVPFLVFKCLCNFPFKCINFPWFWGELNQPPLYSHMSRRKKKKKKNIPLQTFATCLSGNRREGNILFLPSVQTWVTAQSCQPWAVFS